MEYRRAARGSLNMPPMRPLSLAAGVVVGLWPAALLATGPGLHAGTLVLPIFLALGAVAGLRLRPGLTGATIGLVLSLAALLAIVGWEPGYFRFDLRITAPGLAAAAAGWGVGRLVVTRRPTPHR